MKTRHSLKSIMLSLTLVATMVLALYAPITVYAPAADAHRVSACHHGTSMKLSYYFWNEVTFTGHKYVQPTLDLHTHYVRPREHPWIRHYGHVRWTYCQH